MKFGVKYRLNTYRISDSVTLFSNISRRKRLMKDEPLLSKMESRLPLSGKSAGDRKRGTSTVQFTYTYRHTPLCLSYVGKELQSRSLL